MSESRRATVEVDLNPLGKGVVTCDATIYNGVYGQPNKISIEIVGVDSQVFFAVMNQETSVASIFGDSRVSGAFENGLAFETDLVIVENKSIDLIEGRATVLCSLGRAFETRAEFSGECRDWKFRLANLRFRMGDCVTIEEIGGNDVNVRFDQRGRLNRIEFEFAGRNWYLEDDLFGRWGNDPNGIHTPIVSGTLSTQVRPGDNEKDLLEMAASICSLLTFALAHDVKWIEYGCYTIDGKAQRVVQCTTSLLPFNQRGFSKIDNWETGNLKAFLEVASTKYLEETKWWSVSIAWFMQSRGSKHIEVKCAILNILIDRITTKILGESSVAEIDADLPAKLDDKGFRKKLHELLETLSPNWDRSRTGNLINQIKEWNKRPSFPKKIARACEKLGIHPIAGKKLSFRHVLMHRGEMDGDLKSPDEQADYLIELESLVMLLMCRMFGFDGQIYLQIARPYPKQISDFLAVPKEGV